MQCSDAVVDGFDEDPDKAIEHLKICEQLFSCFCDIQAHFDPFEMGDTETELIKLEIS